MGYTKVLTTKNDNYMKSLRLPLPQALDWGKTYASELLEVTVELFIIVLF
jgi:hypothetical protein